MLSGDKTEAKSSGHLSFQELNKKTYWDKREKEMNHWMQKFIGTEYFIERSQ